MNSLIRNGFMFTLAATVILNGCQTHDRVIYTDRPVKHLRVGPHSLSTPTPTPSATTLPTTTTPSAPEARPGMPAAPAPALPGAR